MAVFVTTCPHCAAQRVSFSYQSEYRVGNKTAYVFAICAACHKPISLEVSYIGSGFQIPMKISEYDGNVFDFSEYRVRAIWPKAAEIDVPAAVPERVARNFVEAAESRKARRWNAACGSYRRCMEIALKQFAPDVEAWKLEKRIDKLAAEHRITPDIQKWAHELRLDGNQAVHADEDATEEMVDQMHHLTYFLLTYLYTLPNQIEEVRARRAAEVPAE